MYARSIAPTTLCTIIPCANLYRAAAALALGRDDIVDAGLREFLGFAARERVLTCAWWFPELVAPLLLYAVQHGIESAWAQRLLAERFTYNNTAWFAPGSPQRVAELEIARRVQMSLMPELPPAMPDLDVASTVLPAVEVGGDFVAYFPALAPTRKPASGASSGSR